MSRLAGLVLSGLAAGSFAMSAAAASSDPVPAQQPTEQPADGVIVTGENPAKSASNDKITDPRHPDFVKCRSQPVLNSRAARVRVCRTNKEWAAASREGNRQTQELLNMGRATQPSP